MPPGSYRDEINFDFCRKLKEVLPAVGDEEACDFADKYYQHEDEEKLGE